MHLNFSTTVTAQTSESLNDGYLKEWVQLAIVLSCLFEDIINMVGVSVVQYRQRHGKMACVVFFNFLEAKNRFSCK